MLFRGADRKVLNHSHQDSATLASAGGYKSLDDLIAMYKDSDVGECVMTIQEQLYLIFIFILMKNLNINMILYGNSFFY